MKLDDLKKPLKAKWRVQSFSKRKAFATCIPYVDSRDVQNRLDEVCGPENWQSDYKEIKGNVYAGIAILIADRWIWKWDCGTESKVEKEKGEASDSFKRAAVKWGVARDLYESDLQYARSNEPKNEVNNPYVIDDDNKRVYDLTDYINKKMSEYPKWWNQAIDYMRNGGTIDQIKLKYKLTPKQEQELKNA